MFPLKVHAMRLSKALCASFKRFNFLLVKDSVINMFVPATLFFEKNTSFRIDLHINLMMMVGDFVLSFFRKGRLRAISMSFLHSLSVSLRLMLSLTMSSSQNDLYLSFCSMLLSGKQCNLIYYIILNHCDAAL